MSTTKLTVKQQRFVDVYDGNATDAARKAGYKGNDITMAAVGKENLVKPLISEALKNRENKRNGKYIATRLDRQKFWTTTMSDQEQDMRNRLQASNLLGKSEADFTENLNVSLNFEKELAELE